MLYNTFCSCRHLNHFGVQNLCPNCLESSLNLNSLIKSYFLKKKIAKANKDYIKMRAKHWVSLLVILKMD
eukprot:g3186.t1